MINHIHNYRASVILTMCVLVLNCHPLHSQHVLSHFEIQGGAAAAGNEFMITDHQDNIYVGFVRTTWLPAVVGDSTIYGSRLDTPDASLRLRDFFLVKFNSDHYLQSTFVIDNADLVQDFHTDGDQTLVSLSIKPEVRLDSMHPIILGGEMEIEREGNRGSAVLVVLDENLGLTKAVIPATGELGQVAVDGQYAYLELRIPDNQEYITVGTDTVYNFRLDLPGMEFGFQTVVLCKYDLITEEVVWWQRIGNVGSESLRDMLIDAEGNLVIHGWTSSGYFTFTETDTAINFQVNKPFVGKYSADGYFLWGILNTNQHGELFHSMKLDKAGNVYYIGEYNWPDYHVGDTILYNEWFEANNPTNRGIIIKYDQDGKFKWAVQLDGHIERGSITDIAFHNTKAIISCQFVGGELLLNGSGYAHVPGIENIILLVIDSSTGAYSNHFIDDGPEFKSIRNLHWDIEGRVHLYLWFSGIEEIFTENISSTAGNLHGFLFALNLDSTSHYNYDLYEDNEMVVYPNPARSGTNVYIRLNNEIVTENVSYSIYTISGVHLKSGESVINNGLNIIDLGSIASGLSILTISLYNKTISRFLLVK